VAILKISTRKGLSPTTRIKIKGDTRMSEPKQTNSALEADNQTSEQQESKPFIEGLSRRTFLGVVSAGLLERCEPAHQMALAERATCLPRPSRQLSQDLEHPRLQHAAGLRTLVPAELVK
jgi:hypothetical protein